MAKRNMVEAINRGLMEEMERDPSVIVLGQDVGKEGGVFRVTDGLQSKFGAQRVVDTPLAESGIVGVALGLAVKGFKPVADQGKVHLPHGNPDALWRWNSCA